MNQIQKVTIFYAVLLFNAGSLFAQQPPPEFFSGLKALTSDRAQAKIDMSTAIAKVPFFHGSYHFLGVIYSEAGQADSAVYYLDKAVSLNASNLNKTAEMSYVRLIEAYAFSHNFAKAYEVGLQAHRLYPENQSIAKVFKDVCIWSYYIQETGLDKSYLSPLIKSEYVVTSVPQEYLILSKLVHNGERIQTKGQSLQHTSKGSYDVHKWVTAKDPVEKEIMFKLNWDMNTEFGGKSFPKDPVIANQSNPIYVRLGALLLKDPKADLITEIGKLSN